MTRLNKSLHKFGTHRIRNNKRTRDSEDKNKANRAIKKRDNINFKAHRLGWDIVQNVL